MLSVIVAPGDPTRLAGLLAALTPAAVEALVREVTIAGEGPPSLLEALCDDTGCELVPGLAAAIGAARSEWLLVCPPEWRPKEGWVEALGDHLRGGLRDAVIGGLGGGFLRAGPQVLLVARSRVEGAKDLATVRSRLLRPAKL